MIDESVNRSVGYFEGFDESLQAFNAGTLVDEAGIALSFTASELTYQGNGRLEGLVGLLLSSSGNMTISSDQFVRGDLAAIWLADLDDAAAQQFTLDVRSGTLSSARRAIDIDQAAEDTVTINVGMSARVEAPGASAITVAAGTAKILLAGAITGDVNLASGDDELTLQPGFVLDGSLYAGAGTNHLIFGGEDGSDTFDLGRLEGASADILGFETFSKAGGSTWTLTGDRSLALDLDIDEGTLLFDGRLAGTTPSQFDVADGAALGGKGEIWDVVFEPGSFFYFDTDRADGDGLKVHEATLGGAKVKVRAGSGAASRYEILVADQLNGAFDTTPEMLSPRYAAQLDQQADRVILTLQQTGVTFASYAKTPGQAAVAGLLDAMGEDAPYYDQLDSMEPEAAAALLEQLSGSGFASTGGALLQTSAALNTASLGRTQQQSGFGGGSAPAGYASFTKAGWLDGLAPGVWGRMIAGTSNMGGSSAGSATLIGGADVDLGGGFTLGVLAGMGSSAVATGNTTIKSADLSAGVYGAAEFGMIDIRYGGSLTYHAASSSRQLVAPGVNETLTAAYGALTAQLFIEAATSLVVGPVDVELFGDLGYARHVSPGFTEVGGAGALTVAASSSDAVETTVGARFSRTIPLGTQTLTLGGTFGWRHRFTATPSTSNSFAGGTPFDVAGTSTAGSALVAGANANLDLDPRSSLDLAYDLEWGSTGLAHAISARYRMNF